jgi:ATP-binding cassette subfamily F protein 3
LIQLTNIHLAFGGQVLFDGLSWTIPPRERIGLIGKNGAGKSTLLKIVTGQMRPDEGRVMVGGQTTVGYLEQDVQSLNSDASILEEALTAFEKIKRLEREELRITDELAAHPDHSDPEYERLLHLLESVHAQMTAGEAHRIKSKAEAVLTGLGFEADDMDRAVRTFSGGWRMRVALAKLLLRHPDFLLLDEPTNHLDIDSIDWLENYLKAYTGTVVMVSHDRYFLDRMVTSIAELAHGRIDHYAGNYAYYLEERGNRWELQRSAYENQQKEITQIERFVERFRYKASKASQVQSRVKMLDKMERVPPPPSDDATVDFRFPEPSRSGRVVLELSTFSKRYDTPEGVIEVFDRAGPLTIERGDKVALIGKNGAGKSTLARILNGAESFDGTRKLGHNVELSFFAQHQAESLRPKDTILESLRREAPMKSDGEIRSLLGTFLFSGEDAFKPISVLSGGEKSRVALARTLLHPANFLILDEPTNHLDTQSIAVLIEALKQYTGTLLVVSHDRHFLDQVSNRVWYVAGGDVHTYIGNYSEFRWQAEHGTQRNAALDGDALTGKKTASSPSSESLKEGGSGPKTGPKTKVQKRREAEERNRQYRAVQEGRDLESEGLSPHQLQQVYEETERQVVRKEERIAKIESELADPAIYDDADRVRELNISYEASRRELAELYEIWEDFAEQLAARADA